MRTTWSDDSHEDAECNSDDSELQLASQKSKIDGRSNRLKYVVVGLASLIACALLTSVNFSISNSEKPESDSNRDAPVAQRMPTARSLLESDELTDVATDQLLEIGHKVLHYSQRSAVRALVAQGFKNVTIGMQQEDPEGFQKLCQLQLTREQSNAMLHVLTQMTSPKVVNIGVQVGHALMQGKHHGKEGTRRILMKKLQPRLPEIRHLREDIVPAVLRRGEDDSPKSNLVIDPDHLYVMKVFPNKWKMQVEMSHSDKPAPSEQDRRLVTSPLLKTEQAFGVIGAILEQARIVMDQINAINPDFKNNFRIPAVATGLVGTMDYASNLLTCMIDGFGGSNPQLLLICPLRFASAASDIFKLIRRFLLAFLGRMPGRGAPGRGAPGSSPISSSYPFYQPQVQSSSTSSSAPFFQPASQSTTTQHSLWPW